MPKVLVTGGAGFIGSHLCDELLKRGLEVVAVDNLITGDLKNIEHLKDNPHFDFINHDISTKFDGDLEISQIYHLASPASPNKSSTKSYLSHPLETMLANAQGTWNLAELALEKGAQFLFASTSEVYGDPLEHPQKESYKGNVSATGVRSVYDESKRYGETITSAFIREKNLDGRIVRIFNTYGPRMGLDDGRAIIEFTKNALQNKPITIFGNGVQTRSFCYISDMVSGIIAAMLSNTAKGEVINLGNPEEITILDLAQKIKHLTNSTSEIVYQSLPSDDPQKRQPDIEKARTLLAWEPKISLEEGLPLFIDYVKRELAKS